MTKVTTNSTVSAPIKKPKRKFSEEDQEDGLLFNQLLQDNQLSQQNNKIMQEMHNSQNQQIFLDKEQDKKDQYKVSSINQDQTKSVESMQQADKAHTAEFCQALKDNNNKHSFEVNLPKVGKFNIDTERGGNKLTFKVASKEKLACDWLKTHQSSIENNVSQDLGLEVSLGIEHVG